MKSRVTFVAMLSLALLSACAPQGENLSPQQRISAFWESITGPKAAENLPVEIAAASSREWWRDFNDETLNALMATAHEKNFDIKIASARVREARASRIIADSAIYPTLDGTATANRGNKNNIFNDKPANLFEAGFDAGWEIDLFGRIARLADAAEATISAREADERAVQLSLQAEVARNYISLRNAQAQLAITEATAKAQGDTAALTRTLMQAGLGTELDAARADALSHTTRARLPVLETQITTAKNALAVLLATGVDALPPALFTPAPVPNVDASAPLSMPTNVVASRPDVQGAERELMAATALTRASIAEQYPSLSLSAFFGIRNTSLAGGGGVWSAGSGLLQPIFNAGRIRANIAANDARADAALSNYEKTVLNAQSDIATATATLVNAEAERDALARAEKAANRALELARVRYRKGISPFIDVLTAERDALAAESSLADAQAKVSNAAVALYKALGV